MTREEKLKKSYNYALSACNALGVTPLFSFSSWKGFTEMVNKKCVNCRYPVTCNKCGQSYRTYFKRKELSKSLMSCPSCGKGQKNQEVSYYRAKEEASKAGISLLSSMSEWKGRKALYNVKCNTCGLVFQSHMISGHMNNCPYCNESSSEYNQLVKLKKLCADNLLTLLDNVYIPSLTKGRPTYKVQCNVCGTVFRARFIGKQVTNCPKCCARKQRSNRERGISAMLDSYNILHYNNYRGLGVTLPNSSNALELDIYIPHLHIGFEFNGQAFHNSSKGLYHKDINYHKWKTEQFLSKGVKVYHIWDFVSDDLSQSIVRSKVGLSERIYARACCVSKLSLEESQEFLSRCHPDGWVKANHYYGLYHNNDLVAVMSFVHKVSHQSKNQWEISRFATELNTTVVGGFPKLLKDSIPYLVDRQGKVTFVVTCNRDLAPDYKSSVYSKHGFRLVQESGPLRWYWASKSIGSFKRGNRCSLHKGQRQKLFNYCKELDLTHDPSLSVAEYADLLGLKQVYNSGSWRLSLEITK